MSLKDISIKQYQQIMTAVEGIDPDNEWDWFSVAIATLYDEPIAKYRVMSVERFKPIKAKHSWLKSEEMPTEWVKEFDCHGESFKVMQRTDQWNVAQFISMATLTNDRSQIVTHLHKIMAVLSLKHQGEDVPLDEFNRRAELFQEHLSPMIAYPIALFYAAVLTTLYTNTRTSLLKKRVRTARIKRKKLLKAGLVKSGDGMK